MLALTLVLALTVTPELPVPEGGAVKESASDELGREELKADAEVDEFGETEEVGNPLLLLLTDGNKELLL